MSQFPARKRLNHDVPSWVESGSLYFITLNCKERGTHSLCRNNLPAKLFETVEYYQNNRKWHCALFLLMPDHLHALLSFPSDLSMTSVIRSWKRYTAKSFGIQWQSGFFDHCVRDDESWEEKAHYIRMNPVRKGLVEEATDWPYVLTEYNSK